MKENRKLLTGMLLGAVLSGISVYLCMNNLYLTRFERQQRLITQQAELMDSVRFSGLAIQVSHVLARIDDELKDNPKRTLSDEAISRIAALCYNAKPYLIREGDSLSAQKTSPERGQLLAFLSGMKIDSGTLRQLFSRATFSSADLRDSEMQNADLRGADLSKADLYGAKLEGGILNNTNLKSAILWGANLSMAKMTGTNLKAADLRWSDLTGAEMQHADFNGADLSSAQIRKADLQNADLHYTNFTGAFLQESNLSGSNMYSANLKKAQLANAVLSEANMTSTHLNDANLTGANLTNTQLSLANLTGANLTDAELTGLKVSDKDWLNLLDDWRVTGAEEIQRKYKMVESSIDRKTVYSLQKIRN